MSILKRLKPLPFFAALIFLCSCVSSANLMPDSVMSVHFMDVGQADSIFIELPDGKTMLVDAGGNSDGKRVCEYIRSRGGERIDYLVGTHPHADHIGGMDDVIREFEIGELYMPKVSASTKTFDDVLDAAEEKEMKIKTAKAGKYIFETESTSCRILSPTEEKYSDLNEYSVILMLSCGDVDFLLTGDAEAENEYALSGNIGADVLKVAHHGSDTSSSAAFLKRVNPDYAVISVGAGNKYSHPSENVLKRLAQCGTKILRTDVDGDIIISTDGENIFCKTEKGGAK